MRSWRPSRRGTDRLRLRRPGRGPRTRVGCSVHALHSRDASAARTARLGTASSIFCSAPCSRDAVAAIWLRRLRHIGAGHHWHPRGTGNRVPWGAYPPHPLPRNRLSGHHRIRGSGCRCPRPPSPPQGRQAPPEPDEVLIATCVTSPKTIDGRQMSDDRAVVDRRSIPLAGDRLRIDRERLVHCADPRPTEIRHRSR